MVPVMTTTTKRLFDAVLPPTPCKATFAAELHAWAKAHEVTDASARRTLLQIGLRRAQQREHLDDIREQMGEPNGV
jgi:hypothetical protein